ncbi:hypothetical protein Fcan01_23158 [Folsomia candida]|uniref:Uncharacterized protein n=1 Tax=Folsomia candida TaxID=158441 RepID=A0A226DBU9_FOLCA|nr:hypothetical protein Fcan01_23158 [Folsomia candida]
MLAVSFALMTLFLAQVTHAAMIEDGKHYWNETLQGQSDGHLLQGRYLIYPIPAINTNGWDFSMMSIVYDTELRTTVSSTGLYNSENAAGRTRPPTSSWRLYFNEGSNKLKTELNRLIMQEIPKSISSMAKPLKSTPTIIRIVIKRDLDKIKRKKTKLHALNENHIAFRKFLR